MKENQRIALTKRLLQEALLRLMIQKPLEKITITELCEEAGINRLNHSFPLSRAKDIPSYIEELMSYLYEHSELLKIFLQNTSSDDFILLVNEVFERFLEVKNRYVEIFDSDDENLKLISSYIAGGGYFMLSRWLSEDIQKTPKEITDLIFSFMNHSVNLLEQQ